MPSFSLGVELGSAVIRVGGRSPTISVFLNPSKLCRPPLRASIRRSRLLRRLDTLSESKLAVLCAEAGYGKTTLLLDFLRGWSHPTVWYRLDKTDRDLTRFVAYLAEGIAQVIPGFGHEVRERLPDGVEGELAPVLPHLLLREIGKLTPLPLLLVLDNFEAVAPSHDVCSFVSELLEYSGSGVRVAIASRTMPPLPIIRLEAGKQAVTLGPGDLALTSEESLELLVDLHAVQITDAQLGILWRRTEGWPAGLVIIAEALQRMPAHEVVSNLEDLPGPLDRVYRYFVDEVFQQQSAALQEFLIRTSILTRLTHDVVNDLLEIDNGGDLLAAMESGGMFAHGVEVGGGDLRYHTLFRAFLRQKLHARYRDDYIGRLYRTAAESASRHRHWDQAIDYYAAVEDWQKVGELVERLGEELTRRGFLETVQRWLNSMPEEQVTSRPILLMLRGRLLRQAGRHHEALRDLNRALRNLEGGADRVATVLTELEIGMVHNWLAEFQRAETVLMDALHRAGDDAVLRSRVLAELSANCIDELEKGAHWGQMAVADSMSTPRPGAATSMARGLRFYGRVLVLQGDFEQGLKDITRSVDLCRTEDLGDLELAWSLFALGQGLTWQGALDEACRVLDEAESLAHACYPLLNWIWFWRGTAHRDAGAFDRAEQELQRARHASGRAGIWAQAGLAFLRVRQGRHAEGLRLAEECRRSSSPEESLAGIATYRTVHGIALAVNGDRSSGTQQLAMAAETFRELGRQQQLASVQWHLARFFLEEGRCEEALGNLGSAIRWMSARGVYNLWWWDSEAIARLWPLAIGKGWADAYLLELARLRLGPRECHLLYGAVDTAPPKLRTQLMGTLHAVSGNSTIAQDVAADLLKGCGDPVARRHISEALASGILSPDDLAQLRAEASLTWKEIEVLIMYYLSRDGREVDPRFRRRMAEALVLSEHTLKAHIRNIRRKLDLDGRPRGSSLSPTLITRRLRPG